MTAIVRDGASGLSAIEAQAQALDVALRAAAALKGARGLLPEALKSEGEIVAVLLAGQELGLPPMASLRGLQVVRGKVIISYDTMIALLRRAGYRIEWLTSTATEATLRLTAPDGSTHTETWTGERAKKAGLWGKGTWSQYPDTMLRARCVSSAARAFAGEVLAGVYVEEAGERAEIESRAVRAASSDARADLGMYSHEKPAPDWIDVEPEASCGTAEPVERPADDVPKDYRAARDEAGLRAWIARWWLAFRDARGEARAAEAVLSHAERIGLAREDVVGWLALATPTSTEAA